VLGGTELPLILTEPEYGGLRMLDTTAIHVARAVAAMLEPEAAEPSLDAVRARIDALDREIVALLARRGEQVRCAAAFKQDIDAVKAPQRVEQVIAKVRALAQGCGAEPQVVEATYRAMIAGFIESELAEQDRLRHPSLVPAVEESTP